MQKKYIQNLKYISIITRKKKNILIMFHLSPVQKGPVRKNLTNILKKSFQCRHPDKNSDQIPMVLI